MSESLKDSLVAGVITRSNYAMWVGLAVVIGLLILLDDKSYSIVAILIFIYFRLQTMQNNMLLISDWLDRFKPDLRRTI